MSDDEKVFLCKKMIKEKLFSDSNITSFMNEFEELYNVLRRTIDFGESDSVLVIGSRGSGKTTVSYVVFVYLFIFPLCIT